MRIDAKSTNGPFERPFHLSGAEMAAAADPSVRYDIVRVFEIDENGAKIRIAERINAFAAGIIGALKALPAGVLPDGFSVDPRILSWSAPIAIVRPEDPE